VFHPHSCNLFRFFSPSGTSPHPDFLYVQLLPQLHRLDCFSLGLNLIFISTTAADEQPALCCTQSHLVLTVCSQQLRLTQCLNRSLGSGFRCFFSTMKLMVRLLLFYSID
jgi:hypothetical protein